MTDGVAESTLNLMRDEWREGCTGRLLVPIRDSLARLERLAPANQTIEVIAEIRNSLAVYQSTETGARRSQVQAAAERLKQIVPQLRTEKDEFASIGVNPAAVTPAKRARPQPAQPGLKLTDPVTRLKGVGAALAAKLGGLGITTIEDLLNHVPRSYVDFSAPRPIGEVGRMLVEGSVTIAGTLSDLRVVPGAKNKRVEAVLSDRTGWARLTWFNPFLAKQLNNGDTIVVHGPIDPYRSGLALTGPEWQRIGQQSMARHKLVPIYPLTHGVGQPLMRRLTQDALEQARDLIVDPLLAPLLEEFGLRGLPWTYEQIHFPGSAEWLADAKLRLAFNEMYLLQLGLIQRKRVVDSVTGNDLSLGAQAVKGFLDTLPFRPTMAQTRAINDVKRDLGGPSVMQRLVQGDVGSGKTLVAAAAIVQTIASGYQAAVMAPTEILARQLFATLNSVIGPDTHEQANIALLTGSTKKRDRSETLAGLLNGELDVLVGTQALIQEGVVFDRLGLTVVDEQHRFGVRQRGDLPSRGQVGPAHVLTMSATPIPRSLHLVLLGDIDVSVIDEMPPGREPVTTKRFLGEERQRAYTAVRQEVTKGRQAFVICPLVEDSADSDRRSAVAEAARLQRDVFPDLRIDVLHGRMSGKVKDDVMRRFRDREFDVLVATSVIEVGIDIPNATVMLIEGADRFGLSQLHQFRGRVGRGGGNSYCLLLADDASALGEERLRMMESTTDGFALAEADLRMRGPGDFLGTRQSGLPDLQMLRGGFDSRLLSMARRAAEHTLDTDPALESPSNRLIRVAFDHFWQNTVSAFAGA
jgi:ATP-dependent DNA helicase RecG